MSKFEKIAEYLADEYILTQEVREKVAAQTSETQSPQWFRVEPEVDKPAFWWKPQNERVSQ